jgi:hypothetical protein
MTAPVYRNAEAENRFLGLSFPVEVLLVLGTFWPSMLLGPTVGMVLTSGVYVGIRVVTYGRPDSFVQHHLLRQARRVLYRGRLSAAARSRTPAFPFGPYLVRLHDRSPSP